MSEEESASRLPRLLAQFLRSMSDEDVHALERGELRIALVPSKTSRRKRPTDPAPNVDAVRAELAKVRTRETAYKILESQLPSRAELHALAIALDLPVPKSDTVSRLRERIVEFTIGYRLRSLAIRDGNGSSEE